MSDHSHTYLALAVLPFDGTQPVQNRLGLTSLHLADLKTSESKQKPNLTLA